MWLSALNSKNAEQNFSFKFNLYQAYLNLLIKILYSRYNDGSITDRSQRRSEFQLLCKENQNKILFTSNKKTRSQLENSNSHKRRFNEQARLLKIK